MHRAATIQSRKKAKKNDADGDRSASVDDCVCVCPLPNGEEASAVNVMIGAHWNDNIWSMLALHLA